MKPRDFEARRLDVKAFAKAEGRLTGSWALDSFERLRDLLVVGDGPSSSDAVHWVARGRMVAVRGGSPQVWLDLQVQATLPLLCQRCLLPCSHAVAVDRQILFVADEETAADLDAELEHDVLVFAKELDLHETVEDELLLDLPVVPRHESCPEPLLMPVPVETEEPREHPFAALAGLRPGKA
jgi:uncharacterized protein